MEQGLEELLDGKEPEPQVEEPKVEEPKQPEPEQASNGPIRDEHGRFAPKETGDKQEGPPPSEEPANVPRAALQDERRKRQELEQQIAAMQQQYARQQEEAKARQAPPDFWENPQEFFSQQMEAYGQRIIQNWQQQQTLDRLTASEAAAKAKYTDYEDAFGAFQQAVQSNPSLIQQMTHASDPGEFAYTTGKRAMDLQKVGSFDELLKAERAKWEAEAKAAMPAPNQQFPASTAQDGSAASRNGPAWSGPPTMEDLLKA